MTTEAAFLASAQERTIRLMAELDGVLHLGFDCAWTKTDHANLDLANHAARIAMNTTSSRTAAQKNDTIKKAILDLATAWSLDTAYIEAI